MLALIDKQQVRKRTTRFSTNNSQGLPTLVERPRSVAGQRWLTRREPLFDQLESTRNRSTELLLDQPVQESVHRKKRLTSRIEALPLVAAVVVALAVVGVVLVSLLTRPTPAPLPKGGLQLPADTQIAGVLAEYSQASTDPKPDLPVQLPNTSILQTLKTSTYTLKKGDTISGIAKNAGVSVETLISFNGISDVRRLTAGMTLKIPSMNGTLYRVRKGDSLGEIAKAHGVKLSNILDANSIKSAVIVPGQELFLPGGHMSTFALKKALGTLFMWPTTGAITSPFGMRHDPFTGIMEFHNGIDIANVVGTPIKASMDGQVALVGRNRGYGNFIILNHGDGFQTLYGHLSKSLVQKGEYVKAGQKIGLMGDTGYATGPHLHFTIYKNSAPVNPLIYLEKK